MRIHYNTVALTINMKNYTKIMDKTIYYSRNYKLRKEIIQK